MTITHIFFDLHGTLIDGTRLHPCYSAELGRLMTERFGLTPQQWIAANRQVLRDWDHYYADLDLTGEDGMAHLWEGLYRTTRALFRITRTPEPDKQTLTALSREIPGAVTRSCDALYHDARSVIERLAGAGYTLGVTTHALSTQARGVLEGARVLAAFNGPIIGPDVADHFEKDETFYRFAMLQAGVAPEHCLTVDDSTHCILGAKAAGLHTVQLYRKGGTGRSAADFSLHSTLDGLVEWVAQLA